MTLQNVLTAHCSAHILSNQYGNDALLIGDVVISADQCHSSSLAFDFNHMSCFPITL